jgi:hypothetical protein
MEEPTRISTSDMLKSASVNGVYVALVSIIIAVLMFVMNFSIITLGILGFVSFIITYVLVVFLSIKYRKDRLNNEMKYVNALVYTLIVGLVACLISSSFSGIYQFVIDPTYVDGIALRMQSFMEAQGVAQAKIDEAVDGMLKSKEIGTFLISQAKSILLFNLLIILFAPLFVKKSASVI